MSKSLQPQDPGKESTHKITLPGFLVEDDIGLGELVKKATFYLGISACGGCERRSAALDRWMSFTPKESRK